MARRLGGDARLAVVVRWWCGGASRGRVGTVGVCAVGVCVCECAAGAWTTG